MTKTKQKILKQGVLPKQLITAMISETAQQVFDVKWSPRVVRQQRQVAGSLTHVDYAVPCFDIAQQLSMEPQAVTSKLAAVLCKNKKAYLGLECAVEAVGGYINFQLSDEAIKNALATAIKWYKKPTAHHPLPRKNTFLVLGMGIYTDPLVGTTDKAFMYLRDVYQLLGVSSRAQYIIDDNSEELVKFLHNLSVKGQSLTKLEEIRLYGEIKKFLATFPKSGRRSLLGRTFNTWRSGWASDRKTHTSRSFMGSYKNVFVSKQAKSVHEFLNTFSDKRAMIIDKESGAAYYIAGDDMVPLRSASGMLYPMAFVLYNLDVTISKALRDNNESVVILGSHKMNILVSDRIRAMVSQIEERSRIGYFDPRVSRANILEIESDIPSLKVHFSNIAHVLEHLKEMRDVSRYPREALLSLLDTPVEMSEYASDLQMPSLLDSISQSAESLQQLSR